MEKDQNIPKLRLARNLLRKNLYITGHCGDSESEEPTLHIRIFEGNKRPVGLAFTSFLRMKRYFDSCGLVSMKYMHIASPSHLEAFRQLGLDVVINPDSPEEAHLTVQDLRTSVP